MSINTKLMFIKSQVKQLMYNAGNIFWGRPSNPVTPPYWKSLTDSCRFKSKLVYNCGSHAEGDSQKFKLEEIEEL